MDIARKAGCKWTVLTRGACVLLPWLLLFSSGAMAQLANYGLAGLGSRGADAALQLGMSTEMAIVNMPRIANAQAISPTTADKASLLRKKAAEDKGGPDSKNKQAKVEEEEMPNEFQDFVAQSIRQKLPIYGHNLFGDVPDTFAPVENIPVTPDYLIGPGDEIVIKAWGQIDIDYTAIVNRNGAIDLPKIGSINVAGIRYQQLQSHVKNAIGRVFRNFDLTVTLGNLRSIQVFVVGQAKYPGVYTVSSLSTLVNTLFASGGPSINGSLRQIQVKRNGKLVTEFDLYDLLLKGDKTKDISLSPGDVIYFPPVGHLVAISGSVNNPAIYELSKEKTTLADLIGLAGGFTTTASGQKVIVERIIDRTTRRTEEFELDKIGLAHQIQDGDLIQVKPIKEQFDNAVTLRGNVADPGRRPWKQGMRVKDLIPNMDSLIMASYWKKQNQAFRTELIEKDDLQSRAKDDAQSKAKDDAQSKAKDDAQSKAKDDAQSKAKDDAQSKAKDDTQSKAKLDDMQSRIKNVTSEINWDYAVIERLNKNDLTNTLIPFNLGKAINDKESPENYLLQPGDVITIFSKNDIQVPIAKRSIYVSLEGEINAAGVYKVLPGETLRQLIERVGGLTPNAYLFAAELNRKSVREMQQKRLKTMSDRMEADIRRTLAAKQQTAISVEDAGRAKSESDAQIAMVERLKNVEVKGRVVLEISPTSVSVKDIPDIALEDGDSFIVPSKPSTVSVMGMVYNENTFLYHPGRYVSDYLEQAGGPTRDADESRIYLLRADGSVISTRKSNSILGRFSGGYGQSSGEELMPGDTVVVPELLDRLAFTKELKDWSQILYQFALGVAAIQVLKF